MTARGGPAGTSLRRRIPGASLLLALLPVLLAANCRRAGSQASQASQAEEAIAIETVFESPEPYSPRTLDPLGLAAFFARNPDYRADSAAVAAFYARRGMQFAWFIGDSLTASADAFIGLVGVADTSDPHVAALARRLVELHEEGVAEGRQSPLCDSCALDIELRLTAEFFHFAAHNYGGHLSRDLRELNWYIPRAKKDLARLMDSLAVGKMDLSAYEPRHPQYALMRAELPRVRALDDEPWPDLALPRRRGILAFGDTADVVTAIRRRLHRLGDLGTDDGAAVVDGALVAAVERFQARHGLTTDGIVGPAVLRALNVPPAERLRTMLVNMERLRWMPEDGSPSLLVVNIPEYRLHVYEDGREVMSMRAVVGAHATRTVIFASTLTSVVLSPTWTVPPSIVRNEVLPAMREDPSYLERNNMEIIGGTDALPTIRQRPGADNALGRVKFVFPNSFGIFMHDTPARSLFDVDKRAFSHGCIRLSDPRDLALHLLRDDPAWPPSRIDDAMLGGVETTVPLRTKRPVLVVYFTSWVDAEGLLHFREDVYGHDRRLATELFR